MHTKVLFTIFLFFHTVVLYGQNNLSFSKSIYVTLSSNTIENFIADDTTFIIPEGRVWKLTSAKTYSVYDNRIEEKFNYLYLDNQVLAYSNKDDNACFDPVWLPAGEYALVLKNHAENEPDSKFNYIGYITGVEYLVD